jgi:outer membrane protein OmpA-like peptidoglycan-associated protein
MLKKNLCLLAMVILVSACASNKPKNDANAVKVTQTARGAQLTTDERLLFSSGKAEVGIYGMVYIERVAAILKNKTKANVAVEGHTDNVGSAVLNQQLSVQRANAVKDALVKQGIAAERMQAQGFGMTKPVADNNTPEGRQANRRTEIILLGETVEAIGGESTSSQLNEGFDRFIKGVKGLFGS